MNKVLAAEQRAREAVEQCRRQANALVAKEEERARRLARRTERRIKAAHRIADKAVERSLRELGRGEVSGEPGTGIDTEDARVRRAVARLVEEIIGSHP
jgi:hypothetical protein